MTICRSGTQKIELNKATHYYNLCGMKWNYVQIGCAVAEKKRQQNLLQIIYIDLAFEYGNCFANNSLIFCAVSILKRQGIAKRLIQVSHFDAESSRKKSES